MSNPLDSAWPDCLVPRADAPAVKRRVKEALGFIPRPAEYTACVPWMVEIDRLATSSPVRSLEPEIADLGALAAAHATGCRHSYGGARASMRLLGYSEAQLRALSDRAYGAGRSPRLQAAAELIRRVVALEAKAADVEAARAAGFDEEQIAELVMIAALAVMYSRVATPLAIPPSELEATQRGFFAPFSGLFFRMGAGSRRAAWRADRSELADTKGPFSRLLSRFVPSPAAREVSHLLHGCIDSDLCPRRGRLLAMAVVARVAKDEALRNEVRGLLASEGIPSSTITSAVATLDAPELYDFERALLLYASESVAGSPADLQERARFFVEGRAPALVIDAIGAVAVANGLARMSLLRSSKP